MGKNCLRKQRKKNESDGLFHLHLDGATPNQYISSSDFEQNLNPRKHEIGGSLFFSDHSPATSPKYERMRLQITAVLKISFLFGLLIFMVALVVWIYNAIYYPVNLSNGLKYILGLMAVEGQALACSSLMGREIYRKQFTSRPAMVFYNSVATLVVILLTLACTTQPDVNEMVDSMTYDMNTLRTEMYRPFPEDPYVGNYEHHQWCCDYQGYKPICNESSDGLRSKLLTGDSESQAMPFLGLSNLTVHLPQKDGITESMDNSNYQDWVLKPIPHALQRKLDSLCGRLYGWSMADTLVKSMSHYVVPGFMCITLMATLIHLATCPKGIRGIHSPEYSRVSDEVVDDNQPV